MMMKKIAAVLLTLTAFCAALPSNAFAADQTVTVGDGGSSCEVTASATVTDQDLEDLGLNVVVSFPTEVALSLDKGTKSFKGSGNIYACGVMDSGKSLTVAVDPANAAYGKVKYRVSAGAQVSSPSNNFFASVTEKLVKVSNSTSGAQLDEAAFSASETLQNYLDKAGSDEISTYARLDVELGGLIPASGKGIYFTNVPFKIAIQ